MQQNRIKKIGKNSNHTKNMDEEQTWVLSDLHVLCVIVFLLIFFLLFCCIWTPNPLCLQGIYHLHYMLSIVYSLYLHTSQKKASHGHIQVWIRIGDRRTGTKFTKKWWKFERDKRRAGNIYHCTSSSKSSGTSLVIIFNLEDIFF